MTTKEFKFYHADRCGELSEGMIITGNDNGLSNLGISYWFQMYEAGHPDKYNKESMREMLLESVRVMHARGRIPRLNAFFGAESVQAATDWVRSMSPLPDQVRIFEVYTSDYDILDANWIDLTLNAHPEAKMVYYKNYWSGTIADHETISPDTQEIIKTPPKMEVLMMLPVRIGKLVEIITINNKTNSE